MPQDFAESKGQSERFFVASTTAFERDLEMLQTGINIVSKARVDREYDYPLRFRSRRYLKQQESSDFRQRSVAGAYLALLPIVTISCAVLLVTLESLRIIDPGEMDGWTGASMRPSMLFHVYPSASAQRVRDGVGFDLAMVVP